jgi:hypothetical protein
LATCRSPHVGRIDAAANSEFLRLVVFLLLQKIEVRPSMEAKVDFDGEIKIGGCKLVYSTAGIGPT